MNRSESIKELAKALAIAQSDIKGAIKDKSNDFYNSDYADLASCIEASRGPLTKNGLSVVQLVETVNDKMYLTTILMHFSGEFIESSTEVATTKKDAQGYGSAITYFRRYCYNAMVGVAPVGDDDDGNAASDINEKRQKPAAKEPTRVPVTKQEPNGTLGNYKLMFTKRKGCTIEELYNEYDEKNGNTLRGLLFWLSTAKPPLSADALEFQQQAESYLKLKELTQK